MELLSVPFAMKDLQEVDGSPREEFRAVLGCHSTRGYHARGGRGRRPLRSSRLGSGNASIEVQNLDQARETSSTSSALEGWPSAPTLVGPVVATVPVLTQPACGNCGQGLLRAERSRAVLD